MKLYEKIENRKRQLANYLNSFNENFSLQTRKRIFATVGILMGCICLAMMIEPFRNPTSDRSVIQHNTGIPVVIVPPNKEEPLISDEEFSLLDNFKQMMDSLNIYDNKSYKEIFDGREGLMDSIDFLMRIYR
jgi:hypothetical protein